MRAEDYPPQEPFSDAGRAYHDEVMRRAGAEDGVEARYGDDPYQSVLVFAPREPTGDVLMFLHGGGWTNGYKEWMAFMAPALTAQGITFVSAGYRLAPQHVFPTGFEDATRALAWVHGHVEKLGASPERLFVGGHSAGGHYAALMAVRRDWQDALGLPADVVRGCLPISGVYLFGEGSGLSMRPRFLGDEDTETAASPVRCIEGTPPPFLMAHGDSDFPHLMKQAEAMEAALRSAGSDVRRLVLDGRDHFSASYAAGEADGPWVGAAAEWMRGH